MINDFHETSLINYDLALAFQSTSFFLFFLFPFGHLNNSSLDDISEFIYSDFDVAAAHYSFLSSIVMGIVVHCWDTPSSL